MWSICPNRLRPPKPVPTFHRLRRTTLGCLEVGCGNKTAMPGVPESGPPRIRIGSGFPPIMSGHRRGYVFVDGYWDYSIGRRGVLFAPVYFSADMYTQPGFSYSPATVINPACSPTISSCGRNTNTTISATTMPQTTRPRDSTLRIRTTPARLGYDPIFAHERWQHRQDGQWEPRIAADFQYRRDHADARPPRTWAAQTALGAGEATSGKRGPVPGNAVLPIHEESKRSAAIPAGRSVGATKVGSA